MDSDSTIDREAMLNHDATLNRMEPGVAPVGIEQSLASIAISLKRIVDELGWLNGRFDQNQHTISADANAITSAINSHSIKVHVAR